MPYARAGKPNLQADSKSLGEQKARNRALTVIFHEKGRTSPGTDDDYQRLKRMGMAGKYSSAYPIGRMEPGGSSR